MDSEEKKYYRARGYSCKTLYELQLFEVLFKSPEVWLCKYWYYDTWDSELRKMYIVIENPPQQLVPMAKTTFIKRKIQFGLE